MSAPIHSPQPPRRLPPISNGDRASSLPQRPDGDQSQKASSLRHTRTRSKNLSISFAPTQEINPMTAEADTPISAEDAVLMMLTAEERAERGLITSMETRRNHIKTASGDSWHAAAVGERPPLGGNVPFEQMYSQVVGTGEDNNSTGHRITGSTSGSVISNLEISRQASEASSSLQPGLASPFRSPRSAATGKLVGAVRKIRMLNLLKESDSHQTGRAEISAGSSSVTSNQTPSISSSVGAMSASAKADMHRRTRSRAHAILNSIQESTADDFLGANLTSRNSFRSNKSTGSGSKNSKNQSEESASVFQKVGTHAAPELGESHFSVEGSDTDRLFAGAMAVDKLLQEEKKENGEEHFDHDIVTGKNEDDDNNTDIVENDDTSIEEMLPLCDQDVDYGSMGDSAPLGDKSRRPRVIKKKKRWDRYKRKIAGCFNPISLLRTLCYVLAESYFFTIGLPALMAAWILYYYLGNPTFYFLPGHASLSWWLNFFGRQCVTFELARVLQWLIIDKIVLGTRTAVKLLGPFLTLYTIQARGWPFLIAAWGVLDMFLLKGKSRFQLHWFYFTDINIYSVANSGSYILDSDAYLRLLIALVLAGFATAGKRTIVAMFFGRRTFSEFKPRLESILKDVILVSEIAELADEAERMCHAGEEELDLSENRGGFKLMSDDKWSFEYKRPISSQQSDHDSDSENANSVSSHENDDHEKLSRSKERAVSFDMGELPHANRSSGVELEHAGSSGSLQVKNFLEKWEEPENKMDKSMNTSIHDILKFRRALTFIDDAKPFGEAFGPASSRDEVITSARNVFYRLLTLSPNRTALNFDVLSLVAEDEEGDVVNPKKKAALRKMFRPNAQNELSLLNFLQSCDSLYKKLRFFRASVGNASVIDNALEGIIDGVFYFILSLTLLSIMRFNPWPLLVSISTLLVSISFAIGSSASKYIEGILLIALRRPYDLGDRIYMTDPSQIQSDGLGYSWFVQDINLFTTTVRYAGTNEVATINNGSIAGMRIVNGNRSPNAAVWFEMPFHISVMEKDHLVTIRSAMAKYARDHPRRWHSFGFCRLSTLDIEKEKVQLLVFFQSRSSWQDLSRIKFAKADLMWFTYQLGKELGVHYEELPRREVFYQAGQLKTGALDYRKQLTQADNLETSNGNDRVENIENLFPTDANTFEDQGKNLDNDVERRSLDAIFLSQLQRSHG